MTEQLLARMAGEGRPARTILSKAWRRYAMRHLGASDNHTGLERLYALPDPWDMASRREQSRFEQTTALIASLTGEVDSVLEVGSGEGHQSAHLLQICRRLDGIDVSHRAVARAQQRVPAASFFVGEVTALPAAPAEHRYDLVVACEVLYYMGDIPAAIAAMSTRGRACFVTFFAPAARVVARHLEGIPNLQRGWIYHEPYAWLWAFWRPE